MRRYLLFLLIPFTLTAIAGVYTYTDSQGVVVFTDTPETNNAQRLTSDDIGKPIVIKQANPAPQATTTASQNAAVVPGSPLIVPANVPYKNLAVISPQDQETIQNQPVIPVSVTTDPPLQKGDSIQILLDGAPWGPAKAQTSFNFTRPDRGTHTISAVLLNSNQQVLIQTKPITVFIHQAHLGTFQ